MLSRRGFFAGIAASLAAPAIVRAASLMPVRPIPAPLRVFTIREIMQASIPLFVKSNEFLANLDKQQFVFRDPQLLRVRELSGVMKLGDSLTLSL